MPRSAAALLLVASCSYEWTVGPAPADGGGGGAAATTSSSGSGLGGEGAGGDAAGGGGAAPQDCPTLLASYAAALEAAKACSQSEVGVCDADFTDLCGCKVFLAHTEGPDYPESAAARQARDAVFAAMCDLTALCASPCGPDLVTGACAPVGMSTACSP